jgi:3-phenylpropionate/cinnamic acid dioxygenase small subunit
MPLTLEEVKCRAEITDTLHRYAQGVDQRAWNLFLSAFTEDALIDVVGYLENKLTPAAFRDFLATTFDEARLSGQHFLSNTLFRIAGDEAHTVTEFLAVNLERSSREGLFRRQVAGGLYVDVLRREASGWRIARRTIVRKSDDVEERIYLPQTIAAVEATLHSRFYAVETNQEKR